LCWLRTASDGSQQLPQMYFQQIFGSFQYAETLFLEQGLAFKLATSG
jgi:hypothetical protein